MLHRRQLPNFQHSVIPMSSSFLPWLFKPRYRSIKTGVLFEHLCKILYSTPNALSNDVNFTLVNVCSPFSNFSHGANSAPHKVLWPIGSHIIFTFALDYNANYAETTVPKFQNIQQKSNRVKVWTVNTESQFLVVGIDKKLAYDLNLVALLPNTLQYLYNTIGMMTKAFTRHNVYYQPDSQNYEDYYRDVDLTYLYQRFYDKTLGQLIKDVPYYFWPFNRTVWELCPNLLSERTITATLALYYFMHLTDVRRSSSGVEDCLPKILGLQADDNYDNNILQYLDSSLMSFVQYVNRPTDIQFSNLELIAPAVVQSVMLTGNSKIQSSSDYRKKLTESIYDMSSLLASRPEDLGRLFLPTEKTARKLLLEDTNYANTLLGAMNLSTSSVQEEVTRNFDRTNPEHVLMRMAATLQHTYPSQFKASKILVTGDKVDVGFKFPVCHYRVAVSIPTAKDTDKIVLLKNGSNPLIVHSILVDKNNNILMDRNRIDAPNSKTEYTEQSDYRWDRRPQVKNVETSVPVLEMPVSVFLHNYIIKRG